MQRIWGYLFYITLALSIFSCSSRIDNGLSSRAFSFNYTVAIESTNGEKLEVWLPIPSSNEVQTISNLKINTSDMSYTLEEEEQFGNKYLYILEKKGINEKKNISIDFNVTRIEHKNVNYRDIEPSKNLTPFSMVPTGDISIPWLTISSYSSKL